MERDENDLKFVDTKINFNSHAHVERDDAADYIDLNAAISTHTLTWSVTCSRLSTITENVISTHTLTWSVTELSAACMPIYEISTHTLTWSVTDNALIFRTQNAISTHTLTWSVTSG